MSRSFGSLSVVAVVVVMAGCPAKKKAALPPDTGIGGDCDPLVDTSWCGYPFPSSVYLKKDTTTKTGWRVNFGQATLPAQSGTATDPTQWNQSDGFSPGQAPMTVIAGATATGLPTQDSAAATGIQLSLDKVNSPTLLLEDSNPTDASVAPTLVPHFAEVDVNGQASSTAAMDDQALMIRPVVRLKDNTRYIVAIRNVKDSTGAVVPPTAAFAGIVSGSNMQGRANLYANIFAKLKAAGIETSNLQIAWDYYTASTQNNTQQLLSMRDQAFAAVSGGIQYTIVNTTPVPNPDSMTGLRIFGKVHVPLFLDSATVGAGSDITTGYTMTRDANGDPVQNGFGDFHFIVNVPASVYTDTAGAPILFQGHGLFGARTEGLDANDTTYSYLLKIANDHKYVTITTDMIGWRTPDGNTGANPSYSGWPVDYTTLFPNGDPNTEDDNAKASDFLLSPIVGFRGMIDRGTQGLLNELIATRMLETTLANDPIMKATDGHSFVDPTKGTFYRGDSQGGILGITYMALSPTVKRGYLGETGMPYNLLLTRSSDFGTFGDASTFLGVINLQFGSARSVQLVLGLMQMFWDRYEGDGFAPFITSNELPCPTATCSSGMAPAKNVLINDGLGDFQVTPLGAHIVARAVGAEAITPEMRPIFGVTAATSSAPFMGSGILEYDFGVLTATGSTVPQTDMPPSGPDGTDPHDKIRQLDSTETEQDTFFQSGNCESYCGVTSTNTTPTTCVYPGNSPG